MGKKLEVKYYAGDTENTVPRSDYYMNKEDAILSVDEDALSFTRTLVWAGALCPVGKDVTEDDVLVFDTTDGKDVMEQFIRFADRQETSTCIYFHNLAYDGKAFMETLWRLGYRESADAFTLKAGEYSHLITGEGVWYNIKVRTKRNKRLLELRDSLKILPFSVDKIAKDMKTHARKLKGSIDYKLERKEGWVITAKERKYIQNDVLVMAEALAMISEYGLLEHLTIGSACMHDFISRLGKGDYKLGKKFFKRLFPELDAGVIYGMELHKESEYSWLVDENGLPTDFALRKSYKGAWCYNNTNGEIVYPKHRKGYVYDVNSLYPSVMHSHYYPFGLPIVKSPDEFDSVRSNGYCYIVHGWYDFTIKPGHLPFIQIKGSIWRDNEYLTDSGDLPVELTFTRPEYELFCEQYDINSEEVVDLWVFDQANDFFNEYIDYWYEIKKNAPNPVIRMISKLMLNNLYGKFATSPRKSQAHWSFSEEKQRMVSRNTYTCEHPMYIPVGAFITAYARCVTVRAAQQNYENFCYSDTDSIHLTDPAVDIAVGKELGEWDNETCWSRARFVRQKTYIEQTIEEKGKPCKAYLLIKACGASQEVKDRLLYRVTEFDYGTDRKGRRIETNHRYRPLVRNKKGYTAQKRSFDEVMDRFTFGLTEVGKLQKYSVPGGCILKETFFSIKYA